MSVPKRGKVLRLNRGTTGFGPLTASAMLLLERTRHLADTAPLDTLHFLHAALDPGRDISATQVLDDISRPNREHLIRLIMETISIDSSPALQDGMTERLSECIDFWLSEAENQGKSINDAFILWAVITHDERIEDTTGFMNRMSGTTIFDKPKILLALEGRFETDGNGHEEAATADSILKVPDYIDRDMFSIQVGNLLDALAGQAEPEEESEEEHELVLLWGHKGSPIDTLEKVLAYHLSALHKDLAAQDSPLQKYRLVRRISIRAIAPKADADQLFKAAKAACLKKGQEAILFVDHLEELSKIHGTMKTKLQRQLADQGECLIFGRYVYSEKRPGAAPTLEKVKDELGVPLVPVDIDEAFAPEDPKETTDFVFRYYLPQWEKQGYTFTPDAFDHIIALEPGAWIDSERMRLPYLAVRLAKDSIGTAKRGENFIKKTAQGALKAFVLIEKEWNDTSTEIKAKYKKKLDAAKIDILALIDQPLPSRDEDRHLFVLTGAHVVAQLICHNGSEFHFPGKTPELRP